MRERVAVGVVDAELGGKVDAAEGEARHHRPVRDLRIAEQAGRGLDERDDGQVSDSAFGSMTAAPHHSAAATSPLCQVVAAPLIRTHRRAAGGQL